MNRPIEIYYLRCSVLGVLLATSVHAPLRAQEQPTVEEAQAVLEQAAETARQRFAGMSFEEFKAQAYQEPFPGGKYIVNGDTPIANEKLLQEFFEQNVKNQPVKPQEGVAEFIVHQVGGLDAVWSSAHRHALTYCVSDGFGSRYNRVVADMDSATLAWEAAADINFIHLSSEDSRCNASNTAVVFDVRPVQVNGRYLARAFFPNEPRVQRNVLIDESSFTLNPNGNLQLVGILRHELGHTIGARHEHTRPDSGACFEDTDWRPLTDYDPFSVMHYPQCNGLGDWSLRLTSLDQNGVACLYGPAPGFIIDTTVCTPPGGGGIKTEIFENQTVAQGGGHNYGPFDVKPGTLFKATMESVGPTPGDPDLYLKFNGHPQLFDYDCRPYTSGADEICAVDVPAGASAAGVMVHGYREGHYRLTVTHTEP